MAGLTIRLTCGYSSFPCPFTTDLCFKDRTIQKESSQKVCTKIQFAVHWINSFCDYQVIQIIWWWYNDDDHSHRGGEQHHLFTSSFFLHWALSSNPKTNPSVLFHWLPFQNMYSENDASFWGNAHIIAFCLKGLPSRNDSCNDFFFKLLRYNSHH